MDLFEKVIHLDAKATDFGFAWEHHSQLIEQLLSECDEVKEVIDDPRLSEHLQEELGDLIFTAIALCVYCKFDPKLTLDKSLEKFEKRFQALQKWTHLEGLPSLHQQSMATLKRLWDKAKEECRAQGTNND